MTYRIVPRTEIGLDAVVTNSNGTPRPPLSNEPYVVAHYTGNNVDYTDKVTEEVVRQIQRVFATTKPYEYNYVIGQEDNDEIYEFAGKYQAAHSAGENHLAFGVLFLLGVGEDPTPRMIDKWKWLRDVLIFDGSLAANVMQRMHREMPGAATACPGGIIRYWDQFLAPWTPPQTSTPIPQEEEEIMIAYIAKPPASIAGNPPWLLCVNGAVRYATNVDSQHAVDNGWAFVQLNEEQYPLLLKGAGLA